MIDWGGGDIVRKKQKKKCFEKGFRNEPPDWLGTVNREKKHLKMFYVKVALYSGEHGGLKWETLASLHYILYLFEVHMLSNGHGVPFIQHR